jgi:hypothetical protein
MRLTLDWDDADAKSGNLSTIRERYEEYPWELRRSSSGTGWHLIVYDLLNDTRQGVQDAFNLRDVYDDDDNRLRLDRKRWATGSPFIQVLYRDKYVERREQPAADGTGYSTGMHAEVIEQSTDVKAAPESERIKDPDTGGLYYGKIPELLVDRYGSVQELAEKQGVSTRTVYRWINGESYPSDANQKGLRRKARSQGIGHYAETSDGSGEAADQVRYVDNDDERRTLVEYVDIPLGIKESGKGKEYGELDPEDREYGLLNVHTGTFNPEHSDQQIKMIHEKITEHVLEVLSPQSPDGTKLNVGPRNEHHSVTSWSREYDSINYEREILDDGEKEVYVENLPESREKPANPENYPLFEVLLWNEDMTDLEWQVIGVWTGEEVGDAVILKDQGLGRF